MDHIFTLLPQKQLERERLGRYCSNSVFALANDVSEPRKGIELREDAVAGGQM